MEIDERLVELDATISTTSEALNCWSVTAGHLVLPHTSLYLRHPKVLKVIDFPSILNTHDSITVLFPVAVIEELDRDKRRNDDGRNKALVALAVLENHAKKGLTGKWNDAPTNGQRKAQADIWFDVLLGPLGAAHSPSPTRKS